MATGVPYPFGPCRVCQAKSTGIHYGVATCEGCKGFFKRSIMKNESYRCYFGANCNVMPDNRNRCKFCRFKRCLDLGMSMEAVKMGRIPKAEKEKALTCARDVGDDEIDLKEVQVSGGKSPVKCQCECSGRPSHKERCSRRCAAAAAAADSTTTSSHDGVCGNLSCSSSESSGHYTESSSGGSESRDVSGVAPGVAQTTGRECSLQAFGEILIQEGQSLIARGRQMCAVGQVGDTPVLGHDCYTVSHTGATYGRDNRAAEDSQHELVRTVHRTRMEPLLLFLTDDVLEQLEQRPGDEGDIMQHVFSKQKVEYLNEFQQLLAEIVPEQSRKVPHPNVSQQGLEDDFELLSQVVSTNDLEIFEKCITVIIDSITSAHLQAEKLVDYQIEMFYDEMRNPAKYAKLMEGMTADDAFRKACEKAKTVMRCMAVYTSLLPGYTRLHADEQKQCIRDRNFEVWLVNSACYLINGQSYLRYSDGTKYTRELMIGVIGVEMVETLFEFAENFNALELNASEISLIKAILLTKSLNNEGGEGKSLLSLMNISFSAALRYCLLHKANNNLQKARQLLSSLNMCMRIMARACDFNKKKVLPLLLKRGTKIG